MDVGGRVTQHLKKQMLQLGHSSLACRRRPLLPGLVFLDDFDLAERGRGGVPLLAYACPPTIHIPEFSRDLGEGPLRDLFLQQHGCSDCDHAERSLHLAHILILDVWAGSFPHR